MHRKPQLQHAARKLQEIINNRREDISYAQALEISANLRVSKDIANCGSSFPVIARKPGRLKLWLPNRSGLKRND